jgi:hypothetical protein
MCEYEVDISDFVLELEFAEDATDVLDDKRYGAVDECYGCGAYWLLCFVGLINAFNGFLGVFDDLNGLFLQIVDGVDEWQVLLRVVYGFERISAMLVFCDA